MKRSNFKAPKIVLVFNGARVLIGIFRSLHSAAQFSGGNLQAISFCCSGKYISTGGFYFRYLHSDIHIEVEDDLDNLKLEKYDEMCQVKRRYHSVREMARRRAINDKRRSGNLLEVMEDAEEN